MFLIHSSNQGSLFCRGAYWLWREFFLLLLLLLLLERANVRIQGILGCFLPCLPCVPLHCSRWFMLLEPRALFDRISRSVLGGEGLV
ncbi:hypothetical protein BC939DRAFT_444009 [Gamsiella multidivaricata]|uniref:uncharacterized protein n=1 Tax=Gamsiella multidivaricata TaxID=101098 RepID=UPI00221ED9E1|nr:uncharacterized protein BC939DRAFT_444009 [Gamsiella multidivaricata]KAI7828248.1 hypothetical protein BC939DRAFT_444009 [Gamsiella multidivaricata]